MIAEIGLFASILALLVASLQAVMPLYGVWRQREAWISAASAFVMAQFVLLIIAFVLLAILFVRNDFSVSYVAQNSNTALPIIYRIAAVWGGHEGSLLLWVLMLSGWSAAIALLSRRMPDELRAYVLATLGAISVGFLAFMIFTSNPFARLLLPPAEGRDLNPLLQDPGLIIHPPMLYMGYVGFSVAFAFAIAALMSGRLDSAWAKWARPWTLTAWACLTLGVTLGSWWAYYELGWGGWWFWDPVENASFMPWLAGTALLHSLATTESRGLFKPWTALLAILTFSLCLLGTFLVRSGALTSVHAFAVDPARGVFILVLLFIVIGGSLSLYAARSSLLTASGRFAAVSRETGILLNNIFLTVAAGSVLLGTLYPLILESFGAGKISVGPPYFNFVLAPLAILWAVFVVIGATSRWKQDTIKRLSKKLWSPAVLAVGGGLLLPLFAKGEYRWLAAGGLALALWVLLGTLSVAVSAWRQKSGGFWGMIIAHTGMGVFIIGITMVNVYEWEKDARLVMGEARSIDGYTFKLDSVKKSVVDNYETQIAVLQVIKDNKTIAVLYPEKRRYFSNPSNTLTEAGIDAQLGGDFYASLGEDLGDNAWSMRLQIKPFIRFIWGGALLMMMGGLLAAADRRYRR